MTTCLFCKIIKGVIPCHKLYENELILAFLDINPLSKGHLLIIPKFHAQFLHQVPDIHLEPILPIAKQLAVAIGVVNYNLLQNNGRIANQEIDHVHFHIIPKNQDDGLVMGWKSLNMESTQLADFAASIRLKLGLE